MSCEDKTRIIQSMMELSGADGLVSPTARHVVANLDKIGSDPRFTPAMARSFLHLLNEESDPGLVRAGLSPWGRAWYLTAASISLCPKPAPCSPMRPASGSRRDWMGR